MQPSVTAESQIFDYLNTSGDEYLSERKIISEIRSNFSGKKASVTNKDLILALIQHLECETDVTRQDIYRNALELVVQRTPDDIV